MNNDADCGARLDSVDVRICNEVSGDSAKHSFRLPHYAAEAYLNLLTFAGTDSFNVALSDFERAVRRAYPPVKGVLSLKDFHEIADTEYAQNRTSRAFFALTRYGLRYPDKLEVVCPICDKHIAERCGHVRVPPWGDKDLAVIDAASLIALHESDQYHSVHNFGELSRLIVSYIIDRIEKGT